MYYSVGDDTIQIHGAFFIDHAKTNMHSHFAYSWLGLALRIYAFARLFAVLRTV
jgi:hypothetical protein